MNFLQLFANPVLSKEFRIRMRSGKTPWIISLYLAALALVVFSIMYFKEKEAYSSTNYFEIFMCLSILQYGLIIFVTPGLTAGVISGERERQTLSLLLTTNLSPLQIIIGKWLSALSFILLLIFASLPLYSIVFLFGGIDPQQWLKIFGVYMITILAIGSVGVCVSTLVKRTGAASVTTYAIVFAYTALLFFINAMLYDIINIDLAEKMIPDDSFPPLNSHPLYSWLHALSCINPVNIVVMVFMNEKSIFGNGASQMSDPYWWFILYYGLITIIMLALAVFFFRRVQIK
ncbi:ABC transporter permease [Aneurinibacillus thermoaerophilus]|uniref:ABC transporter permease n=1 Tax=Aneurinibacillus thermoaerophilus TaxID=143495 RepID=A0ABX8YC17_ANETH|nr:ABC transporter permease subunit [Aneurinibacillus thermoaerophilus]QYY43214.1 ABC transporter permease [Aneurinibacillus thermoaerophilus]